MNRSPIVPLTDFLKLFGVVLLFAGGTCGVMGLIPREVAMLAVGILIGLAIHHHRTRSLL